MRTAHIKLTSKRQATFPKYVCETLGVGPGDTLILAPVTSGTETEWVLRSEKNDMPWFGALRSYAEGKDHSPSAIKASIAKEMRRDRGGR